MKRSVLFITCVLLALLLCSANAITQQGHIEQMRSDPNAIAIARSHINSDSRHKLILSAEDVAVYDDLISKAAIVEEIDYGSFKLVIVDEDALGGRAALQTLSVPVRDDQNLILFNGYTLDTSDPEATYAKIPADLRQTDIVKARSMGYRPHGGLYIVQFLGPIKDKWLDHLKSGGAEIVTSIPSNAYIVRASAPAAAALIRLKKKNSFVQFLGDYEPVYRLSPRMRDMRNLPPEMLVDVTVQVIAGRGARRTMNNLKAMASEFVRSDRVLNYHNILLKVSAGQLSDIAHMENVYAVEERGPLQRFDEVQGQIVAGDLSGNVPRGPNYLPYLLSLGFTQWQFGSFVVHIVDDAKSLSGHPDLPNSRVAFQNNPSNLNDEQTASGHGFFNTHIIAGFNDGTLPSVEDPNHFNYGLGIAPFARVGVTAIPLYAKEIDEDGNKRMIPLPEPPSSAAWENVAYGQGARISNNSWGDPEIYLYGARAQTYDCIVRDAQPNTPGLQQMIEVCAVGNEGFLGAGSVHSPATAKNVISVGASESVRQIEEDGCQDPDTIADSANDVAHFSSRGPVRGFDGNAELPGFVDGRIKPDLMAPGTRIVAGVPRTNFTGEGVCNKYLFTGEPPYGLSTGTSQAAPAITGAAALVYQYFINAGVSPPSPAMMKAILMNSTTYMTGAGANDTLPSNNQGMGRLDLRRVFNGQSRMFWDQDLVLSETGQTFTTTGYAGAGPSPFRVTLAWTDAPDSTTSAPYVNDLDLEVTVNGVTYKGNVFSGANSVSGGNADIRNNVESVFLPVGTAGNFTVRVIARNLVGDGVPGFGDGNDQDFALVISNFSTPTPPGNLIATASSTSQVELTWDASSGTFDHYQVERSEKINGPWVSSNVNATSFTDTGVDSGKTYLYRVRAAHESNMVFSDYSNTDLATTIIFTDDPLVPGQTIVKALHFTELRQAVSGVGAVADPIILFNWADDIQPEATIKAWHIQELRNNLNLARSALGFPDQPYTNNPIGDRETIKSAHVQEIRQGVK